jgi:hypothetical protein
MPKMLRDKLIEEALGFRIENRCDKPILVWKGGRCRSATICEISLWNELIAVTRKLRHTNEVIERQHGAMKVLVGEIKYVRRKDRTNKRN